MGSYNIVLTPNSNHFKQTLVVMLSAMQNCNNSCNFYIMQYDWTDNQKQAITSLMEDYAPNTVTVVYVNNSDFMCFESYKSCYEVWYKLLIHKYLPESVDKVLYCDTDILIRKDIGEFYNMEFDDCFLCAAVHPTRITSKFEDYASSSTIGKAWPNYFFGGLLLFNLKKFRESNIDLDFYLGRIHEVIYGWDEGALNYFFWDKAKYVPFYKYNLILSYFDKYRYLSEIYSLSYEERIKKCNSVYHEEFFDEEDNAAIVHFATTGIIKPWNVFIHNNKLESVNRVDESIQPFYFEWWETAKKLPNNIYEEIFSEAEKTVYVVPIENRNKLLTNVMSFYEKVSYDFSRQAVLFRSIQTYKGKKIALLRSTDSVGKFLYHLLKQNDIEVVFRTSKGALPSLTDDEWRKCKSADVIICCSVHGTHPLERDGIKPIMIQDLLKSDNLNTSDYKELISYNALAKTILKETKLLSKNVEKQTEALRFEIKELHANNENLNTKLNGLKTENAEMISELGRLNAANSKLNAELSSIFADNVKLNTELGRLIGENKQLTERVNVSDKRLEPLLKERYNLNKTVEKLENEADRIKNDLSLASAKANQLSEALQETSLNLESANAQIKSLNSEKEELLRKIQEKESAVTELRNKIEEMEKSRSWRITKPFRSIMWFFRKLFGKKEK